MYKPIDRQSNRRLLDWYNFRQQLETSDTPLEDVARYFNSLPRTKYYTDPYDRSTWPTPWELITENEEGLCYTLYERIDGIQTRVYDLYCDKKDIIYYLEKLKQLDAITVYIRTIITEWLSRIRYSRVRYMLYDDRLPQSQAHKNDMNDLLIIKNYI